jgi:hypothetical protein
VTITWTCGSNNDKKSIKIPEEATLYCQSKKDAANKVKNIRYIHGLRTPNEGINQRYLKNLADVADKIRFGHTYKFGIGIEFSAVQ